MLSAHVVRAVFVTLFVLFAAFYDIRLCIGFVSTFVLSVVSPNCVHVFCVKPLINLAISRKNQIDGGVGGHFGCSRCSSVTLLPFRSAISVLFSVPFQENYRSNDQPVFSDGRLIIYVPVDTHVHNFSL